MRMPRYPDSLTLSFVSVIGVLSIACSSDGFAPTPQTQILVELTGVGPLDSSTEGTLHAWVVGRDGIIRSAGPLPTGEQAQGIVTSSVSDLEFIVLTLQLPGETDDRPSAHKLLGGRFDNDVAILTIDQYVTLAGIPLEPDPGTHILATLSDNTGLGPFDNEEAGIWLFDPTVDTLDASYYQNFAPLTTGWTYEGWVVRDYGLSNDVWISYGKFVSDPFRQANARDDTGVGYFSGMTGFEFARPLFIRFPGDDFLSDALGFPPPAGISLPIDLNGDASAGAESRWTHVITIEPWDVNWDAELPDVSRPFFLQPYRNAIGEAAADVPRTIRFHPETLPTGTATVVTP